MANQQFIPLFFGVFFLSLACACGEQEQKGKVPASMAQEPLILAEEAQTGNYGYRNSKGEMTIPFGKYAICVTDTFRTHAIVALGGRPGFWVIDRLENVQYGVFTFDNGPDDPSEGLFRIVQDGKIGYADAEHFNIIIPAVYDCAYPFENGSAKVSKQCKSDSDGEHTSWESTAWQYIDHKGNNVAH